MSRTNGSSLCRLGLIVTLAGVVSLIVMFSSFSPSKKCPPPLPRPAQNNYVKSKSSITDALEDKPVLLLWTWPENYRFDLSDCKTLYNIDNCQLTDDRSLYSDADAVMVYHRGISWDLSNLPPSPRLENLFNLTLSYRQDADIPVRMHLTPRKKPEEFVIPKKDKLVCWIVSNNDPSTGVSARNTFYREFSKHIEVQMFGRAYSSFLNYNDYYPTMASCKFYLAFENSIHKDYIMEKINGPLAAEKNYENFVPGNAFIHVNDFPDAKSLAEHLLQLDKDEEAYGRFFTWRKHLTPTPHLILQNQEFVLAICTACDYIARYREYKEAHDIYEWYFN
ncbi:hypothetical protein ABG768_026989 [Culter alburnus]|uniref:Fucosyltransferase n=1 Tax=Culter alburnus TaxID=194366 RepID=A0AAW2ABW0_CULAL